MNNKNKTTAALLSFFLGFFGVQKFYLGQGGKGILYVLFCWTYIPYFLSIIEGIILLTMSEHDFNLKYNSHLLVPGANNPGINTGINTGQAQTNTQAQNVTINLGSELKDALHSKETAQLEKQDDYIQQIERLSDLHAKGILTDEEFAQKKRHLLD